MQYHQASPPIVNVMYAHRIAVKETREFQDIVADGLNGRYRHGRRLPREAFIAAETSRARGLA